MKKRKIIVIIGTDGTGKTTIATKLTAKFPSDHTEYAYLGMKNYKYKLTERLHKSKSGLMQYLFKYIVYPLDIYCKRICMPANKNIIIDRLPGYPFSNSNKIQKALYSFAIPRIDILIWLHGKPEIIHQRKQERNIHSLLQDQKKIGIVFEQVSAKNKIDICVDKLSPAEITDIILKESTL